jgi:hypothetical protein
VPKNKVSRVVESVRGDCADREGDHGGGQEEVGQLLQPEVAEETDVPAPEKEKGVKRKKERRTKETRIGEGKEEVKKRST